MFDTVNGQVTHTVTKAKWERGRLYLRGIEEELQKETDRKLDYKFLEQVRGFLCHLAMVYEILFPFLKGLHLTLANHLPKRDEEGWKMTDLHWIAHLESKVDAGKMAREEADEMLRTVTD